MHELEQHPVGITVHETLDGAVGTIADRVGVFLRGQLELGRIGDELAGNRIIGIGGEEPKRNIAGGVGGWSVVVIALTIDYH